MAQTDHVLLNALRQPGATGASVRAATGLTQKRIEAILLHARPIQYRFLKLTRTS